MAISMLVYTLVSSASEYNVDEDGTGIHGYDPVAYFTKNEAVPGKADISVRHQTVEYRFATEMHAELFRENPEHYLPKYGGYCSYGVRLGKKFDIDPTAWALVDGSLYLQLNHGTQAVWRNDQEKNIEIAERLWPEIRPIPPAQLADP